MISTLRIKDFGIIDELQVDFSSSFNVLTGETGAGKSILIKALSALLGGKLGTEMIRSGSERAEISGIFTLEKSHPIVAQLEELGIPYEENGIGEVILRRSISAKGKNGTWINDVPVSRHSARDLGQKLMDIFGQNDSFRMVANQKHSELLGKFIPNEISKKFSQKTHSVFSTIQEIKVSLAAFSTLKSQVDYIKFRIAEIEEFKPDIIEFHQLKEKSLSLRTSLDSAKYLEKMTSYFTGSEDSIGLIRGVREVERQLSKISDQDWAKPQLLKVKDLISLMSEVSFEVETKFSQSIANESDIEDVENRLHAYQDIMRKMSCARVEDLMEGWSSLDQKLKSIHASESTLSSLILKLISELDHWEEQAVVLSKARQNRAAFLGTTIKREFDELAMKDASIEIKLEKRPPLTPFFWRDQLASFVDDQNLLERLKTKLEIFHEDGLETVEFWLSPNKGEGLKPLDKVASGGEVSRVMLALKKVLSDGADACVLVFDEIDAGISGRVADIVGAKLKQMAEEFQIICISHLPQVAAYAEKHFKVEKAVGATRTTSTIRELSSRESVSEIAAMLSGEELSQSSITHARALKNEAARKSRNVATATT
ncbi:MAG: DNA repair protein RecN [Pseudomonadota bacterium]